MINSLQKKSRKSAESTIFVAKLWLWFLFGGFTIFCKPFIFSIIHFLFLSQFYNFNFSQVLLEAMIEMETIFYFDYWSRRQATLRFSSFILWHSSLWTKAKHDEKRSHTIFTSFNFHENFIKWCYILQCANLQKSLIIIFTFSKVSKSQKVPKISKNSQSLKKSQTVPKSLKKSQKVLKGPKSIKKSPKSHKVRQVSINLLMLNSSTPNFKKSHLPIQPLLCSLAERRLNGQVRLFEIRGRWIQHKNT